MDQAAGTSQRNGHSPKSFAIRWGGALLVLVLGVFGLDYCKRLLSDWQFKIQSTQVVQSYVQLSDNGVLPIPKDGHSIRVERFEPGASPLRVYVTNAAGDFYTFRIIRPDPLNKTNWQFKPR